MRTGLRGAVSLPWLQLAQWATWHGAGTHDHEKNGSSNAVSQVKSVQYELGSAFDLFSFFLFLFLDKWIMDSVVQMFEF